MMSSAWFDSAHHDAVTLSEVEECSEVEACDASLTGYHYSFLLHDAHAIGRKTTHIGDAISRERDVAQIFTDLETGQHNAVGKV